MFRRIAVVGSVAVLLGVAAPAHAIHFFNGCGSGNLTPAPGTSAATVRVAGYSFTDQATSTPVTHVKAGQSVTWTWVDGFCHSVTEGLFGGQSYGMPQVPPPTFTTQGTNNVLVEPIGLNNSFTHTFSQAGVYNYYCDHHIEVGMKGVVIVDA